MENNRIFSTNIDISNNQQENKLRESYIVDKNEIRGSQKQKSFITSIFLFSLKLLIYMLIMLGAAWVVFLIFFVSSESVVVPDVVGKSLAVAMLELQEKNLKAEIVELESDNPEDKGKVLSQDPTKGINVKQNRIVKLTISKGGMVESIPNFIGIMLKDIYEDYDNTFDGLGRYFDIATVNKVFDESFPGTVLGQNPPFSTLLRSSFTDIQLVVSRGDKENKDSLPDLLGLSFTEIFPFIQEHSPDFEFYFVENDSRILDSEKGSDLLRAGTILEQIPVAGETISSDSSLYIGLRKNVVSMQTTISQIGKLNSEVDEQNKMYNAGLFTVSLSKIVPKHKITIYIQFSEDVVDSSTVSGESMGKKHIYMQFESIGGTLNIPYYAVSGTKFFIHRFEKEVWSYTIKN